MASHSEHFEIIEAALIAAKEDGFELYVDIHDGEYRAVLNLFVPKTGEQIDFAEDLINVEYI
jgi:hypothetical protein